MSQMPPHQPPVEPSYPGHPGYGQLQDLSEAKTSLVLGILSLVFIFVCGPVGIVLGFIGMAKAKEAQEIIAASAGLYHNASSAQTGYTCSLIGVIVNAFFLLIGCVGAAFIMLMIPMGGGF